MTDNLSTPLARAVAANSPLGTPVLVIDKVFLETPAPEKNKPPLREFLEATVSVFSGGPAPECLATITLRHTDISCTGRLPVETTAHARVGRASFLVGEPRGQIDHEEGKAIPVAIAAEFSSRVLRLNKEAEYEDWTMNRNAEPFLAVLLREDAPTDRRYTVAEIREIRRPSTTVVALPKAA